MKSSIAFRRLSHCSSFRAQRGITFLQIAFILGIGAMLLIAAATFGPKSIIRTAVQNELAALSDFKANVVGIGATTGLFTAANSSLEALIGNNVFPATMVTGVAPNRIVTNQWGGTYTVGVGTIVNAGDSIVLTSSGIPAAACTELGTKLDTIASVISINGTQTKANGARSVAATVIANCTAGDNNVMAVTAAK